MRVKIIILILFIFANRSYVYGQSTDSVQVVDEVEEFKPEHLIVPATLITVGALGLTEYGYKDATRSFRQDIAELRGDNYFHIDDYFQYLPAAAYLGLDYIGAPARHSFTDRVLVLATSGLSLGAIVNTAKYAIKSQRPDSRALNSFPSGHTSTAFMGAELVRSEYGIGCGIGAYAVACGIGFMRLWNDRHWFNDVIAGAGVGILCARIGYWMLPVWKRWFNLDDSKTAIAIAPYYNNNTFGASMAMVF